MSSNKDLFIKIIGLADELLEYKGLEGVGVQLLDSFYGVVLERYEVHSPRVYARLICNGVSIDYTDQLTDKEYNDFKAIQRDIRQGAINRLEIMLGK